MILINQKRVSIDKVSGRRQVVAMFGRYARRISPLLGMGMVSIFMFQIMVCYVEQAGIRDCSAHHENGSDFSGPVQPDAPEQPEAGCHGICHHVDSFPAQAAGMMHGKQPAAGYAAGDQQCPNGPVAAIDHPPQLS